jgi:hypothetical protein
MVDTKFEILLLSINSCMLIMPVLPFSTHKQQTFPSIWLMFPPPDKSQYQGCYFFYVFCGYSSHFNLVPQREIKRLFTMKVLPVYNKFLLFQTWTHFFHLIYNWFPYHIIFYIITWINVFVQTIFVNLGLLFFAYPMSFHN